MTEQCACGQDVDSDDPYFVTPCGTHCVDCMVEHAKECEICRNEFDINNEEEGEE